MNATRVIALFALYPVLAGPALATGLAPAYELEGPGLSVAQAGVGLQKLRDGERALEIEVGGAVELALLYWAGLVIPCSLAPAGDECLPLEEPLPDRVLRFDGTLVEGTLIGSESHPTRRGGPSLALGYVADVTGLLRGRGPGRHVLPLADGDARDLAILDGAGLLVLYTDPDDPVSHRVFIHHGLDFAFGEDPSRGPWQVTAPFTFNHGAEVDGDRAGTLVLFVGDCERSRPDRVDVTGNPSVFDRLDGSEGAQWDSEAFAIRVARRAGATSVQIFSEPAGKNPDSLLWVMAALRLPLLPQAGCSAAFWRAHTGLWQGIPGRATVGSVFRGAAAYPSLAAATVRLALRFQTDGPGLLGAAKALLRAGVAAALNAGHGLVKYPLTRQEVDRRVDEALAGRDRAAMLALAAELEGFNSLGCPLQ